MGRADLLEGTAYNIDRPDFGHLVCIPKIDVTGLTLNTFCTCDKPKMLREVRKFPSLTLGLVSLQHLGHNTLHIEYPAVLKTQPRDSSNPTPFSFPLLISLPVY